MVNKRIMFLTDVVDDSTCWQIVCPRAWIVTVSLMLDYIRQVGTELCLNQSFAGPVVFTACMTVSIWKYFFISTSVYVNTVYNNNHNAIFHYYVYIYYYDTNTMSTNTSFTSTATTSKRTTNWNNYLYSNRQCAYNCSQVEN